MQTNVRSAVQDRRSITTSGTTASTVDLNTIVRLIGVLILGRVLAAFVLPVYDDAFITMRYAANLADGNGFVYNQGEWILGTTSPGFGVLLSLFFLVGLPMPDAVVVLNILCDAGTLFLTLRFVLAGRRMEGWLFAALFIASPIMARICVGGMEMSLFLFASTGALVLYHSNRWKGAVAIASLAYFLRPEGVILVAIFCGLPLFKRQFGRAFASAGIAVATVAPFLLILYLTYGHIFSQSILAKSTLEKLNAFETLRELFTPDVATPILLIVALAGLFALRRGAGAPLRTIALWAALYVLAYAVGRPKIWSWYGEPIYYTVLLFASIGLAWIAGAVPFLRRATSSWKFGVALSALAACTWAGLLAMKGPSDVTANVYGGIEEWSAVEVSPGDTIMAYDIGAIGFYSNAYIYDLAALVTPDALRFTSTIDALLAIAPDYFFTFATRGNITPMGADPRIAGIYVPVRRFFKDGSTGTEIDPETLGSSWTQDYVLYRRVIPVAGEP